MASNPSPARHLSGGKKKLGSSWALVPFLGITCVLGGVLGPGLVDGTPRPSAGQMVVLDSASESAVGETQAHTASLHGGPEDLNAHAGGVGVSVTQPIPYGGTYGTIEIPKLGADWSRPVKEGTNNDVIDSLDEKGRFVVSRYVNSEPFGSPSGNVSITGHSGGAYDLDAWERLTGNLDEESLSYSPFTRMDELDAGDALVIHTDAGRYTYNLLWSETVSPDRNDVVYEQVYRTEDQKVGEVVSNQALVVTTCGLLEGWSGDPDIRRIYYFELSEFEATANSGS